jgi:curved DNA-binding protein CbpA
MNTTLYAQLGVSETATTNEIRAAYRSTMRSVHPDRAANDADRARRTARSAEINAAWEVLGDAVRRAAYDAERATPAPAAPAAAPAAAPFAPVRLRRPVALRPRLLDLVALPGSFAGYLLLPVVSPGTTSLAGAAWGAILAIVGARLAAGDGQLAGLADRLFRR